MSGAIMSGGMRTLSMEYGDRWRRFRKLSFPCQLRVRSSSNIYKYIKHTSKLKRYPNLFLGLYTPNWIIERPNRLSFIFEDHETNQDNIDDQLSHVNGSFFLFFIFFITSPDI